MADLQKIHYPWLGAIWKIAAFACYAVLNGIGRYLCGGVVVSDLPELPINTVIFLQDLLALCILLPWILPKIKSKKFKGISKSKHMQWHLIRGMSSALAIITWYHALTNMPIAEAVALSIIGPILGVFGAKLILGEKIKGKRLFALIISLICACIVVQPGGVFLKNQNNLIGIGWVISSAVLFAVAKISTRRLANLGCSPQKLTHTLLLFVVPITLILALFNWQTPTLMHWPWLLLGGALTACALFCVSSSLYHAEVSFLAPFDLFRFTLNVMVGFLAFAEIPSMEAVILVAILCLMMSFKTLAQRFSWSSLK